MCGRRDTGAALVRSSERTAPDCACSAPRPASAGGSASGALLAWALTLAVVSFVFGLMTGALVDFINEDETYRKMLESMGMDMSVPAVGYLSYIAVFLALPFAAFLGWRVGASGRRRPRGAWTTCSCAA